VKTHPLLSRLLHVDAETSLAFHLAAHLPIVPDALSVRRLDAQAFRCLWRPQQPTRNMRVTQRIRQILTLAERHEIHWLRDHHGVKEYEGSVCSQLFEKAALGSNAVRC